ncbi:MAG: hypothetical protein VX278_22490 [Myxococcota bacterium]|nr:hypothetical protein [Myxococcota bacterium]
MISLPLFLSLSSVAFAQGETDPKTESAPQTSDVEKKSNMPMEINVRGRYLTVPDGMIDGFFSSNTYDRPTISAYSVGLEWVLKPSSTNWIFYYEFMGNTTSEGYWDDIDDPVDETDGIWLSPNGLAVHGFGFNVANEIRLSDDSKPVWVSLLIGGGLGAGVLVGSLDRWHHGTYDLAEENVSCITTNVLSAVAPGYERKDMCPDAPDASGLPISVLPILDFSFGIRVNIQKKANVRLDFGIHDLPYIGLTAGALL